VAINEIAFTGYPVTDIQRSRKFFEGLLGLKASRHWGKTESPDWIEYDIGAGCLALVAGAQENGWPPANGGPAAALEVDDFPGTIDKLKAAGVRFQWEPNETPVCWMAVILDPDGNRLVIHRRKQT
jgi:predicted enzyme related to lactoylglutathione lyase